MPPNRSRTRRSGRRFCLAAQARTLTPSRARPRRSGEFSCLAAQSCTITPQCAWTSRRGTRTWTWSHAHDELHARSPAWRARSPHAHGKLHARSPRTARSAIKAQSGAIRRNRARSGAIGHRRCAQERGRRRVVASAVAVAAGAARARRERREHGLQRRCRRLRVQRLRWPCGGGGGRDGGAGRGGGNRHGGGGGRGGGGGHGTDERQRGIGAGRARTEADALSTQPDSYAPSATHAGHCLRSRRQPRLQLTADLTTSCCSTP